MSIHTNVCIVCNVYMILCTNPNIFSNAWKVLKKQVISFFGFYNFQNLLLFNLFQFPNSGKGLILFIPKCKSRQNSIGTLPILNKGTIIQGNRKSSTLLCIIENNRRGGGGGRVYLEIKILQKGTRKNYNALTWFLFGPIW